VRIGNGVEENILHIHGVEIANGIPFAVTDVCWHKLPLGAADVPILFRAGLQGGNTSLLTDYFVLEYSY
jgi:hypothetical protein